MKSFLRPLLALSVLWPVTIYSQNVFNPNDATVRYDGSKPLGDPQNPNTNVAGLQKWVSTATSGISTGSSAYDATSFKSYFLNIAGYKMPFRIKFPRSYSLPEGQDKIYPVMLFLHGAGEAACPQNNGYYNNEKQLFHGGKLFRDYVDNDQFDGFLVYPQLYNPSSCSGVWPTVTAPYLNILWMMIDSLQKHARADIDRVVVNGLSGGGQGSWRMASEYPQRVTKLMPSAGVGYINNRAVFIHIPIWFASGGNDTNPSPATAQSYLTQMKASGADIRYKVYPGLGHSMWYNHWQEPDYAPEMNNMHKANPLLFFQKSEYCEGETINAKLGITQGFYAYEWQKDGEQIALRVNGSPDVVNNSVVNTFTGNEVVVKAFGVYRARFKRTAQSPWSAWSMKPVEIKAKVVGPAPAIIINGARSKVLPALDGSTNVPLQMPAGYTNYRWLRASDDVQVSTAQIYNAPVGVYKAKYDETPGCGPDYSPDFVVVNANGSPKPEAATDLTTSFLNATSAKLEWTDHNNETGFEIYRSGTAGGPYTFLARTGEDATTYTDNGLIQNATYYYVVRAVSETGAAVKSNESSPNGGNMAPLIGSLDNVFAKTGSSVQENFTVSDAPGDNITVSIVNKPGFISLTKINDENYRITVNAGVDNIGFKEITVVATDQQGMYSDKKITILVADAATRSAFVNFGAVGASPQAPWNNWTGFRGGGNTLSNINDESNVATTWDVVTTSGWPGLTSQGHITGNNSGVVSDAVLESGLLHNGGMRQLTITGLNTARRYNLSFISSQNEGENATATFQVGTQTASINAAYNTNRTANLNNITPAAGGTIVVNVNKASGVTNIYLNGLIIEEQNSGVFQKPANLYAETIDRTSVNLTWSDKTSDETSFQIRRSTDSLFNSGVTTITVSANATSYRNTGLSPNTKYWYQIRARRNSTNSAYSNRAVTITASSIVYVNFNSSSHNGPSPWNNLEAAPMSPFTVNNLINHAGAASNLGLALELPFNGDFVYGRSTLNNSGVVPDNVLQSNFWLDNRQVSRFRVFGCNPARKYRVGFFGSSSADGWFKGNYTSTYTINGRTVYLNTWENTAKVVYIGNITPDGTGSITLDFSTTANANYGFNGGIIIQEYTDNNGGTVMNSVVDELTEDMQKVKISVYPNPFTDQINVGFTNEWPGKKISAELYDLSGRLVFRNNYQQLPGGQNILTFRSPAAGNMGSVYMFTLKVDGKTVHSSKLIQGR